MTATATNKATEATRDAAGVLCIGETPEEPKYDVLFRLRGTEYEGLANPPTALMLRYIDVLRKRGANVAVSWLLEQILRPDGYKALTEDASVSRADWQQVCDVVLGLVFGKPETVPKSPKSGSRRTGG